MSIPDDRAGGGELAHWVDQLSHPSSDVARRCVLALRAAHPDANHFVETVLVPCQREVGRRWVRGTLTATMEHRVTALFERVVLESLPPVTARRGPSSLAVVSAEGEQHTLAPLVLAWLVAEAGGSADHLGAGVPAPDLDAQLDRHPYEVAAVSCGTTARLVGALHTIDALRAHGCAVVAGGAGFGTGARYATRLGADAVAPTLADGVGMLSTTVQEPLRRPLDDERVAQASSVDRHAPGLAYEVVQRLADETDLPLSPPGFLELVTASVRTTAAAVLLDETDILADHARWLRDLLTRRVGAGWAAPAVLRHVVGAVTTQAPAAGPLAAVVD